MIPRIKRKRLLAARSPLILPETPRHQVYGTWETLRQSFIDNFQAAYFPLVGTQPILTEGADAAAARAGFVDTNQADYTTTDAFGRTVAATTSVPNPYRPGDTNEIPTVYDAAKKSYDAANLVSQDQIDQQAQQFHEAKPQLAAKLHAMRKDIQARNAMSNLGHFLQSTIQDNPQLVLHAVTHTGPKDIKHVAHVYNHGIPWVGMRDSLGPTKPYAVTTAKNFLHTIPNQGQREAGLAAIKYIQDHTTSEDQANALLSILNNAAAYAQAANYDSTAASSAATGWALEHQDEFMVTDNLGRSVPQMVTVPDPHRPGQTMEISAAVQAGVDNYNATHQIGGLDADQFEKVFQQFQRDTGIIIATDEYGSPQVTLPAKNSSPDLKIGMRVLFEMGGHGVFDPAISAGLSNAEAWAIDPVRKTGEGVIGGLADIANKGMFVAGLPFVPFIELYNNGSQLLGRTVGRAAAGKTYDTLDPKGRVEFNDEMDAQMMSINPFVVLDEVATGVAENITPLFPFAPKPGTEGARKVNQAVSGMLQLILLKKAGDAASAAKAGLKMEPQAGAAELGIDKSLGEYTASGNLVSHVEGLPGAGLQHPILHWGKTTSYWLKSWAFDLTSKPLEYTASTKMDPVWDLVEHIQAQDGTAGDLLSYGSSKEPLLPARLAEDLIAAPSREVMQQVFVDYVQHGWRDKATLEDLGARITSLEQDLAPLSEAEGRGGLRSGLRPKPVEVPVPEPAAVESAAAPRTLAEIEAKMSELFEAQKTARAAGDIATAERLAAQQKKLRRIQSLIKSGRDSRPMTAEEKAQAPIGDAVGQIVGGFHPPQPTISIFEADVIRSELTTLRAEKATVLDRYDVPIRKIPKRSVLNDIAYNSKGIPTSSSALVRWMGAAETPLAKAASGTIRFFIDEIANHPEIINPYKRDKPLDYREQNASTVRNYLRKIGIDKEIVAERIQSLLDVEGKGKGPQDFYDWAIATKDVIATHLGNKEKFPNLPPSKVADLTRAWERSLAERMTYTYPEVSIGASGFPEVREVPVLGGWRETRGGHFDPTPDIARPTQEVGNLPLPAIDATMDVTSALRRLAYSDKLSARSVARAMASWRTFLNWGTKTWKAPILSIRIFALLQRLQIEQAFRARQFGDMNVMTVAPGGIPLPYKTIAALADFVGIKTDFTNPAKMYGKAGDMPLGNIQAQVLGAHNDTVYETVRGSDYSHTQSSVPLYVTESWGREIDHFADDWLNAKVVRQNGYLPGTAGKLADSVVDGIPGIFDESQLEWFQTSLKPRLEKHYPELSDREQYLRFFEDTGKAIVAVTKGDPELLAAVARRHIGERVLLPDGSDAYERYTREQVNAAEIAAYLQELHARRLNPEPDDLVTWRALERDYRQIKENMNRLRRTYGDQATIKGGFHTSHQRSFGYYLKNRFDSGTLDLPEFIHVTRDAAHENAIHFDHGKPIENPKGVDRARAGYQRAETFAGNRIGGFDDFLSRWTAGWYRSFKLLEWADIRGTRGSTFYQAAERSYRSFIAQGYPEPLARAYAQMDGANYTSRLMYDLAARTSAHRAVKDIFWFLPAQQEVLTTWLWNIPDQYFKVFGHALIASKAHALLEVLRGFGWVHKNEQGEEIIYAPLVQRVLDKIPGMDAVGIGSFKVSGGSMVLTNIIPSMSIAPAILTGKLARSQIPGVSALAEFLDKIGVLFSMDTGAFPAQAVYLYEALTGEEFPIEFASPQMNHMNYQRSADQALQYAYEDLASRGILPPHPDGYATEEAFDAALKDYQSELTGKSENLFRSAAFLKMLGSTVSPAQLYVTEQDRQDTLEFMKTLRGGADPSTPMTPGQQDALDVYLQAHPGSLAYTVSYTRYTDKAGRAVYATDPGDNKDWALNYMNGQREYLNPDQYTQRLLTVDSFRYTAGLYNTALLDIMEAATGKRVLDTNTLLTHGFEKGTALTDMVQQNNEWLFHNPEAAALLRDTQNNWADEYGIPRRTYEVTRLAETISALKDISAYLGTSGGARDADIKSVIGQLSALYSKEGSFGEPQTKVEKQTAWYMNTVYLPYVKKLAPLYAQAQELTDKGLDPAPIYDQIQAINNANTMPPYPGTKTKVPDPEALVYGNKSPIEKSRYLISLASKPTTWLTDYQMNLVNYPKFGQRSEMVARLKQNEVDYKTATATTSSTSALASLEAQRYTKGYDIAQQYGQPGIDLFLDSQKLPVERISTAVDPTTDKPFGAGDPNWQWAQAQAVWIADQIRQAEGSLNGYTGTAGALKTQFYADLRARGAFTPGTKFFDLLNEAGLSFPDGDNARLGIRAVEMLYFGNPWTDNFPDEMMQMGA